MSVIKIKRSGAAGSPSSLGQGELAYSYLSGTEANGGDRLYIGTGVETGGNAANIEVIGGTYFTSKLDHTPGATTANSALIVDGNSKLDVINIDNITIDGNTISSTDTNGNILISPDGTGNISVESSRIINLSTPTANTDATTKEYVDSVVGAVVSDFQITGDAGITDTFETGQTLTISGDTGITTTVANNSVSIDLDDTTVAAGSYGSATAIPTFTVDAQGRLTDANTVNIATALSISGDSGTDTVSLLTDTFSVSGGSNITTTVANNDVSVALDAVVTGLTSAQIGGMTLSTTQIVVNTADADLTLQPNGTGDIDATDSIIKNVNDPVNAKDAANKRYVDTIAAAGIHYHDPVRVESPTSLNSVYDNANSGIGATLTNAGALEELVVDGVTLVLNDRVLLYQQANATHNGVYTVTDTGNTSANWVLTRSTDTDSYSPSDPDSFGQGDAFFVKEGDTGAGELYVMNTVGEIVFGTTDIVFSQVAETAVYSAGAGIDLNGTVFSLNTESVQDIVATLVVEGEGIDLTYDDANNQILIAAELATDTNPGVAKFDATNFDVTAGDVTIDTVDGGTY
jgi:hypothetical protein